MTITPMPRADRPWIFPRATQAPAMLLGLLALALLYLDPFRASNLGVTPDEVEYALAARALHDNGRYEIVVGGVSWPPRYSPAFSTLFLWPSYLVAGPEVGNAIFPVTLAGIAAVLLAYALGARVGGAWGGALAGLAVLAHPDFRWWGRHVMTDVPVTALTLGTCLLYLRIRRRPDARPWAYLWGGLLVAAASSMRPVAAAAALPLALTALDRGRPRATIARLAALFTPLVGAAGVLGAYNTRTFGSPLRTGYHFWCPVPYDYLSLTFSIGHLPVNLVSLWRSGLLITLPLGLLLYARSRSRPRTPREGGADPGVSKGLFVFLLLGTLPVVLFHLVYFFPTPRFFLAPVALSSVLTASLLAGDVPRPGSRPLVLLLVAALASAIAWRVWRPDEPPHRRLVAQEIEARTPSDALVISAIDPAYVEFMSGRASGREFVPLSRRVEYADKLVAAERVDRPSPFPAHSRDHFCAGLLRGGARPAVAFVASERLEALVATARQGRRIFADLSHVDVEHGPDSVVLEALARRFRFVRAGRTLVELELEGER